MGPPPGSYYIFNVKYRNMLYLKFSHEPPCGKPRPISRAGDPNGKWSLTVFDSGNYALQSVSHSCYIATKRGPKLQEHDRVLETRKNLNQYYTVEETKVKGQYTIRTTESKLYWFLPDGESETPVSSVYPNQVFVKPPSRKVELCEKSSDRSSWWIFKSTASAELWCTIKFDGYSVNLAGDGPGSRLVLSDDGDVDETTWLITHKFGSKYSIQPVNDHTYVRSHLGTGIETGEGGYLWTIKPSRLDPQRFVYVPLLSRNMNMNIRYIWVIAYINLRRISIQKYGGLRLCWTVQGSEMQMIGLADAKVTNDVVQIHPIHLEGQLEDVDYKTVKLSAVDFAGNLTSIHARIQRRAIANMKHVIRNMDIQTEELLEALVLVSRLRDETAHEQVKEGIKSIFSRLVTALTPSTPKTVQMLIIQLIGSIIHDVPNANIKIGATPVPCLVEHLGSKDTPTVVSACNVLKAVRIVLPNERVEAILPKMTPLLWDQEVKIVEAALDFLSTCIGVTLGKRIIERVKELGKQSESDGVRLVARGILDVHVDEEEEEDGDEKDDDDEDDDEDDDY
ncbi:hypothetical protein AMATHDRAFT_87341 [Amanita thiersii Skay4041]|uniref:Uncharacterized protein n=1 Tax=Amanita thiersii Skay4041 TaxID=703135 RepID=A0A2A9NBQ3_9AGAR|nr:hypothetical protein AMATHDRAFT_87341 [Amanita thiersii Skay4041]